MTDVTNASQQALGELPPRPSASPRASPMKNLHSLPYHPPGAPGGYGPYAPPPPNMGSPNCSAPPPYQMYPPMTGPPSNLPSHISGSTSPSDAPPPHYNMYPPIPPYHGVPPPHWNGPHPGGPDGSYGWGMPPPPLSAGSDSHGNVHPLQDAKDLSDARGGEGSDKKEEREVKG